MALFYAHKSHFIVCKGILNFKTMGLIQIYICFLVLNVFGDSVQVLDMTFIILNDLNYKKHN